MHRKRYNVELVMSDLEVDPWDAMRLAQTTDLFLGMHGEALTNVLFLPKARSVMIGTNAKRSRQAHGILVSAWQQRFEKHVRRAVAHESAPVAVPGWMSPSWSTCARSLHHHHLHLHQPEIGSPG